MPALYGRQMYTFVRRVRPTTIWTEHPKIVPFTFDTRRVSPKNIRPPPTFVANGGYYLGSTGRTRFSIRRALLRLVTTNDTKRKRFERDMISKFFFKWIFSLSPRYKQLYSSFSILSYVPLGMGEGKPTIGYYIVSLAVIIRNINRSFDIS